MAGNYTQMFEQVAENSAVNVQVSTFWLPSDMQQFILQLAMVVGGTAVAIAVCRMLGKFAKYREKDGDSDE